MTIYEKAEASKLRGEVAKEDAIQRYIRWENLNIGNPEW